VQKGKFCRTKSKMIYVRVEVFTAVTMKNAVVWDVERISELGTMLSVTSNC
jgi:hypothetical protein